MHSKVGNIHSIVYWREKMIWDLLLKIIQSLNKVVTVATLVSVIKQAFSLCQSHGDTIATKLCVHLIQRQ